jgi:pyridoxal phosphate enzyme (YggS family)
VGRKEFDFTCKEVAEGRPLAEIDGLSFRNPEGKIIHNRERELITNMDVLPSVVDVYKRDLEIEKYFIGHLQTNKIKYIVPYVALIHGIDSYKLLAEVDKQAAKAGKTVNCLLQLHIAREETKFGFSFDECREMLAAGEWRKLNHIRICGLMGMATNTDNDEQIKTEFCSLSSFFNEVKAKWFADAESFRELSMGMSHDYHEAIAAGSTLIRVGSKIFGERNY